MKEAIKWGEERGMQKSWSADFDVCPDCGAQAGEQHRAGCDIEECPSCHGQYVACSCERSDELREIDFKNIPEVDKDEQERKIRIIESRCLDEVFRILSRAGIKRNSGSYQDYSKAKRLIFSGIWIDCSIYEKQISWITDYLGV